MYGFFAAIGPAARLLNKETLLSSWTDPPLEANTTIVEDTHFWAMVSRPCDSPFPTLFRSEDDSLLVLIDGYIIVNDVARGSLPQQHLAAFSNLVRSTGLVHALASTVAGGYNMLVFDRTRKELAVANDASGSLSLYSAEVKGGGILLSTRPVAIAKTRLVDDHIDEAALSAWIAFGYCVGDRTPFRSIRLVPPCVLLRFQQHGKTLLTERRDNEDWTRLVPTTPEPSVEDMAAAFRTACARVDGLGARVAHLQSAGLDSRLLTAAWPSQNLTCYTYGRPDAVEIAIAKQVAAVRHFPFRHVPVNGNDVAQSMPTLFRLNGQSTYAPRFIAGRQMRKDGFDCVLDGIGGDVFFGGSFYSLSGLASTTTRMTGLLARHFDRRVSDLSLASIAEAIYSNLCVEKSRPLHLFTIPEFEKNVRQHREAILHDIETQLKGLVPPNDSLSILIRNYKLINRARRGSGQQAIMSRGMLEVYSPFMCDTEVLRVALSISPERIAYNRLYLKLYREFFPDFSRIPYGHSLLPLTYGPLSHRAFELLTTKAGIKTWYAKHKFGAVRDWEVWPFWVLESKVLRDRIEEVCVRAGISDAGKLGRVLEQAALGGKTVSTGVLYHLAPIAEWLTLSRSTPTMPTPSVGSSLCQERVPMLS